MKDSISLFRRIRYRVWRFAGYWFLIIGSIMTFYIAFAMLTHSPDFSFDGAWWGLLGCACAAIFGFVIVRFKILEPK